jgi:hypothetical protein
VKKNGDFLKQQMSPPKSFDGDLDEYETNGKLLKI